MSASSGLFVNFNNGYVGIGTTLPRTQLNLTSSGTGSDASVLTVGGGGTSASLGLDFAPDSSRSGGAAAGIRAVGDGAGNAHLTLSTTTGGAATSLTERVRVLSNGNVGIGTTLAKGVLDVSGKMYNNGIEMGEYAGEDYQAVYHSGTVIGQENLYTWFADNSINTTSEPFKATTTYTRMNVGGSATFGNAYYTSLWNGQYMIQCNGLTQDTTGELQTPTNYVRIRLPCKTGVSHALFLKFNTCDRWSSVVAYVCDQNFTTFKRLQGQTNSSEGVTTYSVTSWIGPNGQMSASPQAFHEWQMFSIPKYWIDAYSYNEPNDNKSKYGTSINIAFCSGKNNTDGVLLYLSGIAIRTNPYGLTFHGALALYYATNGGSASAWYSPSNNYEYLNQWTIGVNYNNIRVPICPPKDPASNELPDFYLVIVLYNLGNYTELFPTIYLQNPNNTSDVQLLGQFSPCIRGRYGARLVDTYRYAVGLIVPSPDVKYITYVGGRPYLNIRYDNNVPGRPANNSYCRGFFTEVIDKEGIPRGFSSYGSTPIVYNS